MRNMAVKILCDTSADLNLPDDKNLYSEYDIDWIPMHVIFGTDDYREITDLKTSEFYNLLETSEKHPTTSQSTQHDLLKSYEKNGDKYDEVLSIHVSGAISGAVRNANFAKKMYERSNPEGAKIFIYDSRAASTPFGLIVIKAAQLAKQGLGAKEIVKKIDDWRLNDESFHFSVADLKWLFQGGRLSRTKYYLGTLLSKNPILHLVDGAIEVLKSASGIDKAVEEMIRLEIENLGNDPSKLTLHVAQAAFEKETDEYIKKIKETYPDLSIGKIFRIGGVIAAHTGPRTICPVMTKNFEY